MKPDYVFVGFLVVQHFRALDYGIFVDAVIDFVQFFLAVILVKFLEIGIFLQLFPGFHCPKDIALEFPVVQVIGCVDCHIVAEMAGGLILAYPYVFLCFSAVAVWH